MTYLIYFFLIIFLVKYLILRKQKNIKIIIFSSMNYILIFIIINILANIYYKFKILQEIFISKVIIWLFVIILIPYFIIYIDEKYMLRNKDIKLLNIILCIWLYYLVLIISMILYKYSLELFI